MNWFWMKNRYNVVIRQFLFLLKWYYFNISADHKKELQLTQSMCRKRWERNIFITNNLTFSYLKYQLYIVNVIWKHSYYTPLTESPPLEFKCFLVEKQFLKAWGYIESPGSLAFNLLYLRAERITILEPKVWNYKIRTIFFLLACLKCMSYISCKESLK